MKIDLICVGKIKENSLKELIQEYKKRISGYCDIDIIEVNDESIVDKPSKQEIEIAKNKEGERIIKKIKPHQYVIAFDLVKNQPNSPEYAEFLRKTFANYGANITFVIGGSYGLSDEVKARANYSIGLSNMTFTHQMTRLIVLEQTYRAFKINNNEVYHK